MLILKATLAAFLGTFLALALWHGYQDHQNLHAMLTFLQQVQQRSAAPSAPPVPPEVK